MEKLNQHDITGLILAGGRGTRMGNVNKGLQIFQGKPMVAHVVQRLAPQVGKLLINANQDIEEYGNYDAAVIADIVNDYAGPLAGLHAGLSACRTPFLVSAPCDSPFLPCNLVRQLADALHTQSADIAIATTIENINGVMQPQSHPVFSLVHVNLLPHLDNFLRNGGRKISAWYDSLKVAHVVFDNAADFRNINTLADIHLYQS